MRVPYFDLTTQYAALRDEILGAFDRVCRQATFVLGEEVARFTPPGWPSGRSGAIMVAA